MGENDFLTFLESKGFNTYYNEKVVEHVPFTYDQKVQAEEFINSDRSEHPNRRYEIHGSVGAGLEDADKDDIYYKTANTVFVYEKARKTLEDILYETDQFMIEPLKFEYLQLLQSKTN